MYAYTLEHRWSQIRWLEVAFLLSLRNQQVDVRVRDPKHTIRLSWRGSLLSLSDGGSGDSSSESDGGPGFFDGINDNPSEEAFLTATTKKNVGGRAVSGRGIDGEGVRARLGAADGDGDDDDDGSETADLALEQSSTNGDHTGRPSPAAAATSGERKGVSSGSGLDGNDEASGLEATRRGGRATGTGTGAGAEVSEIRATKRKKCGVPEQDAREKDEGKDEEDEDEEGAKNKGAPPANFSKVDPSLPRAELAKLFPLFLEAECCTVEVKSGQMLYLPAGWFHEVRRLVLRYCRHVLVQ